MRESHQKLIWMFETQITGKMLVPLNNLKKSGENENLGSTPQDGFVHGTLSRECPISN